MECGSEHGGKGEGETLQSGFAEVQQQPGGESAADGEAGEEQDQGVLAEHERGLAVAEGVGGKPDVEAGFQTAHR